MGVVAVIVSHDPELGRFRLVPDRASKQVDRIIIVDNDSRSKGVLRDLCGDVVTELWNAGGICWGLLEGECYKKDKPHRVSYADGAYMIISVNAIKDASPIGKPFLDRAFLYFDDYVLGLLLWNRSWRVKYYPVRAGLHFAHRTTRPALNYYSVRAHVALMNIVKTRFQPLLTFYLLRRLSIHSLMCVKGEYNSCNIVRAIYDGLRLGFYAKQKIGNLILYKAPYVKSALIIN